MFRLYAVLLYPTLLCFDVSLLYFVFKKRSEEQRTELPVLLLKSTVMSQWN